MKLIMVKYAALAAGLLLILGTFPFKEKIIMVAQFSRIGALVALGFGLTLSVPASASPNQDARSVIQTAYTRMDKALAHGDVSAYTSYLHPGFVGIYPQGKEIQGRDEDAASLHQLFAISKTANSSTQLLSCSLHNNSAVVTTRESFSMSGMSKGESITIKSVGTLRGFWVKVGGHWLLKKERSLSDTTIFNGVETKTINGQPIQPATQ